MKRLLADRCSGEFGLPGLAENWVFTSARWAFCGVSPDAECGLVGKLLEVSAVPD